MSPSMSLRLRILSQKKLLSELAEPQIPTNAMSLFGYRCNTLVASSWKCKLPQFELTKVIILLLIPNCPYGYMIDVNLVGSCCMLRFADCRLLNEFKGRLNCLVWGEYGFLSSESLERHGQSPGFKYPFLVGLFPLLNMSNLVLLLKYSILIAYSKISIHLLSPLL